MVSGDRIVKGEVLEHLCYSSVLVRIHCMTVLFQIYCIAFLWVIFLLYLMCMCNLCDSVNVKCTFYLSVSLMQT